jgi:hypothetical protein
MHIHVIKKALKRCLGALSLCTGLNQLNWTSIGTNFTLDLHKDWIENGYWIVIAVWFDTKIPGNGFEYWMYKGFYRNRILEFFRNWIFRIAVSISQQYKPTVLPDRCQAHLCLIYILR